MLLLGKLESLKAKPSTSNPSIGKNLIALDDPKKSLLNQVFTDQL
jgi:hypothetical protein